MTVSELFELWKDRPIATTLVLAPFIAFIPLCLLAAGGKTVFVLMGLL